MESDNNLITIKYKIREEFCSCCDRDFEDAKLSTVRTFDFAVKNILERANWKVYMAFEEELREAVEEYIFETISFYAVSSNISVHVCEGESDKVIQFILNKFKK